MAQATIGAAMPVRTRSLPEAPAELTRTRLKRLGEGIGKVVYASEHWVVSRERSNDEIIALIVLWKLLRKAALVLPAGVGRRLLRRPSRLIRTLRVIMHAVVLVVPRGFWFMTHIGEVWRTYRRRDIRGEALARQRLSGTGLIPERITFPPVHVRVAGWPGWLKVTEATERVEATLDQRLRQLARAGKYDDIELWLDRFLELRQKGWRLGLFSVDAHLQNFGVTGERIVLLDAGGLTNRWAEIEERLDFEEVISEPHIQLGLGPVLGARPDIASRFNRRWKAIVNKEHVRRQLSEGLAR
jgi:hypothetical protein